MFCKKIYVHIKNICLTTIKYELYKKICAVKKYTKNVAKPTELLLALRPAPPLAHVAIAYIILRASPVFGFLFSLPV